jgi:hypothetical protein
MNKILMTVATLTLTLTSCAATPQYQMTAEQQVAYDKCRANQSEAKQLFLPFSAHAQCYENATGKKVNRITGAVEN